MMRSYHHRIHVNWEGGERRVPRRGREGGHCGWGVGGTRERRGRRKEGGREGAVEREGAAGGEWGATRETTKID